MQPISLSVFFPCYNEEQNIESLVRETATVLDGLVEKYEILIINDGSTDSTGVIADRLSSDLPCVNVVHHAENRGYGAALISGFTNSVYDWIFFTDGDNQFFIQEIKLLLSEIDSHDAVIGFRKNRKDPLHRKLYANTWNLIVRMVLDLKVRDLNCAFKLVRKDSVEHIKFISTGALISAELLFRLKKSGARIKETGVTHRPRMFGSQTGGSPGVIIKALAELFKLSREQ